MKSMTKPAVLVVTAFFTLGTGSAFATNGYFTHGTGTKNKGMAGAGLAMTGDAIAIANNPAAALFATGKLDAGIAIFSPLRSYSSSASLAQGNGGAFTIGPNNIDSKREYFFIPHVAYSWALGSDSALGLAFYGRGGMNTTWVGGDATFDPDGPGPAPVTTFPGTFGAGKAGVDLSQAFLDVAYARKAGDNFTWGAALVVGIQAFEATGVATFAPFTETFAASGGTQLPTNLSDNGHEFSTGVGAKLGFQANLGPSTSLAAMYQSQISMGEFDKYADLFAENGGFDIPANAKIGLTFKARENVSVSLDVEHTWFSDADSVGNPFSNIFACPTAGAGGMDLSSCLGGANGAGFGWDDVTTYKVGVEWGTGAAMTWRAGLSHADQPIAESEVLFNILAPAVIEDHVTFGFTRQRGQSSEFNFALMYAFDNDVTGVSPLDPTQTITFEMNQWEVEFGYSWRF